MSHWLLLSLLGPAIYALNNYIDKYLVSREFSDYKALPIYTGILGFVAGACFWIWFGFPIPVGHDAVLISLAGCITLLSLVIYFKALVYEETSIVILLFQMIPVLTALLSYFFLGETFLIEQIVGFVLIIVSSIGLSLRNTQNLFKLNGSFALIFVFDVLTAIVAILMKYVTSQNQIESVLVYESVGIGVGALIVYIAVKSVRIAFINSIRTIQLRTLAALSLNEIVFIGAKSCTFFAYILGPVSIVSVLGNTQIFYGILYGYILNLVAPKIFNENVEEGSLTKKIVFSCLLFMGILLVY